MAMAARGAGPRTTTSGRTPTSHMDRGKVVVIQAKYIGEIVGCEQGDMNGVMVMGISEVAGVAERTDANQLMTHLAKIIRRRWTAGIRTHRN